MQIRGSAVPIKQISEARFSMLNILNQGNKTLYENMNREH